MKKTKFLIIITIIVLSIFPCPVQAQDGDGYPIYIVQPGENLSSIANQFGVDIATLISINNIIDVNLISAGTELIIPGLEGISGVLSVKPVELGETISVILNKYRMAISHLLKLNPITSPSEVYVGTNLVLPVSITDSELTPNQMVVISEDSSLFFESLLNGQNRWELALQSSDAYHSYQLPRTSYFFIGDANGLERSVFSPYIQKIEISPLPITQGHTAVFKVFHSRPVEISGSFDGRGIKFFDDESGQLTYALDGIHALREPGLAELSLRGMFDNGEVFEIDQMVLIESGGYVKETLSVESTLIDEDLNQQESARVQEILATTADDNYWNGFFRYPVEGSLEDDTIGFSSYFGNRRTYNNGEYFGFHGGLDFYVLLNSFNIYAAAPGVVLFAGPMDIRGFTTFIDHGQGVVSGYAHMSEIMVEPEQFVNQGDLIGLIGKTGRVTGPHLHWDIWVNGNQVEPFDWVYNQYP
jgi:murein DD-endopeptidase MepM/ murein hydrolase activator NlpD